MIAFDKKNFSLACIAVILAMICSFVLGTHSAEPVIEEVVKYVEVIPENNFGHHYSCVSIVVQYSDEDV